MENKTTNDLIMDMIQKDKEKKQFEPKGLYVLYDKVAEQYRAPEVFANDNDCIRYYDYVFQNSAHLKASDMILYRIGDWCFENYDLCVFREKQEVKKWAQVVKVREDQNVKL